MLNQYYNFLANRLVDWIESKKDYKVAEKYFVLLEDEKEADVFYRTLKELQYTNKIEFYSDQYNYRTVGILKEDKKFLFVAPVDGVTQDFLVTIRNRVNENRDEWEDTCVIFIVFNPLDSIIGGSYDLTQKSAPFNSENIRYHIEKNISSNTKMKEYEKKILNHYLQEITENTNSSLRDYEIIFTILENESLNERDYSNLGYFYDDVLDTFKDEKTIDERLNKNREYFEKIENIHSFSSHKDEVDEKIEHLVSGGVIRKLANDEEWKAVSFKDVNQGIVDYLELNDSKIEFSDNNLLNENTNYWIRLSGETASKRKTMYIVTTSDRFKEEGLEIRFTERIKNSFIEAKQTYILDSQSNICDIDTSISKDTLIIKYPGLQENETYAGRVRYIHNNKKRLTFNIIFMVLPFDIEEINKIKPNFEIKVRKGKKDFYLDLSSDLENYVFGKDDIENVNLKSIVDGDLQDIKNKELIILETDDFFEMMDTNMVLKTYYGPFYFPIALSDIIPKSVPKSEITIERYRLRSNNHLHYRDNKILTGSQFISIVDDLKRNLEIESFMLKEFALNIDVYGDEIIKNEVELDKELFDLYANLINYYLDEDTLPSLASNTDEHVNMMRLILEKIEERFDNIEENHKLDYNIKNILQLGVIRQNKDYILTPLNPLIIAYNLELYESLLNSDEVPKEQILSTLNPEYLVPYLMIDNIQYKASYTKKEPTWLRYKKIENRQISDLGKNIITQRLEDFSKQYKYLFESNNNLSINIAAFNIVDEKNFFEAIIDYMIGIINRSDDIYDINPVNIYFDNLTVQLKSLFGNLYEMRNLEELEKQLGRV